MKLKTFIACVACSFISTTLHARETTTAPFRFATLESEYQWSNNLDDARGAVARAVPVGTSFGNALEVMKQAGARCTGDRHDPAIARCVYSDWVTVHDYGRAGLFWRTVIRLDDGKVQSLMLDRAVEEK